MENGAVYGPTTEENPGPARGGRSGLAAYFSLGRLRLHRRLFKVLQLLLSLLAFVCEEVVSQCTLCGGLYFFEFVSCSAFLLSLLILIVYCTPVYDRVDAVKVKSSDFYITLGTGCVFLLASIIFVSTHDRTPAETAATVFGFLASFMFLFDFASMVWEKQQESQMRKPEATRRTEATEPLNA
ncbi:cklf-like marvel transmembrane [Lynx pardinus]|uniref:CKLF-like MARVEL transmembrane domain-containing protein 6 n=3 Tax=Felinae TaxID=338152 RepID=A0A6J1XVN7_ACIJB|nr:CKLF-like MARVEL transmembrane domain-containing protein 6 [Felis catus]XP_026896641.1 CKLF-like MARVEL transmembrane domain-containing protein 6 [Acinonyx jubatus]XP_030185790.1 CKLF-like MARVEL transmembrane domain-containing protein 6 [Lynx canadensis]XP_046955377.1 CKLF-like MARVEL transmembrane domain-containing protein 6 [Lynx rufus]VFV36631.1 cklf-like marvel transmembrane [Lynx pardinus]